MCKLCWPENYLAAKTFFCYILDRLFRSELVGRFSQNLETLTNTTARARCLMTFGRKQIFFYVRFLLPKFSHENHFSELRKTFFVKLSGAFCSAPGRELSVL